MSGVQEVPLHETLQERYLAYAMSVIISRALPDVRDGLKPVQRRILYTMFRELKLSASGRYRKSAAVVGEVMGKYHPHGDLAIYEAMARMAQPFSLRAPLVDGQGNFGSMDGDKPAAMRYTECRLQPLASELLTELDKRTVDFQPTYDGQRFEPQVLPAQFPQILVNGSEGIAVGMATRIPPHNLEEVINATVALLDDPTLETPALMAHLPGPDFPTGGRLLNTRAELLDIYETGRGSLKVQAIWSTEKDGRRTLLVISAIPYGERKDRAIEKIGELVTQKKLPLVVDVRDESTDDVRVVLELKQGASPEAVMAYLFKHTPLQIHWGVNLRVLVPAHQHRSEDDDVLTGANTAPRQLGLKEILEQWLAFRLQTVRRRYEHDLAVLRERIHLLEAFEHIFDALDEVIRIIRASEGKRDAAERLMDRFDLDDLQTDAILQLRLYKLARLEILLIREELEEKRREAARIEEILGSDAVLRANVRSELLELRKLYRDDRRTLIGAPVDEVVYNEDAYIVQEDAFVVLTRDGWIKRQSSFSTLEKIRVREGDEIAWLVQARTRSLLTLFTSAGGAYVLRVDDVPATTGHGSPLQTLFSFEDGEVVVGVYSHCERHTVSGPSAHPLEDEAPPPPWGIALSKGGRVLRFPLSAHGELSSKAGRRYARLNPGDAILRVWPTLGEGNVAVATRQGRAMLFPVAEVPILKASGKGVTGIKLREDDEVMAFELAISSLDGPTVITGQGRDVVVRERKFAVSKRGGRGHVVLRRGTIDTWVQSPALLLGKEEE
ncbi:MAG: DNA topoisomerase IV subunit A [Deltaproteobacteria bacterium]|nr:DNA topoisomerase IV subunit A [Deltaproteobacteria bacterium]